MGLCKGGISVYIARDRNLRAIWMKRENYLKVGLLFFGLSSLLVAIWLGLIRLGLNLPIWSPELIALHGPLMVAGFLGVLIGLERAAALNRLWGYLAPLAAALGVVLIFIQADLKITAGVFFISSLLLVSVLGVLISRNVAIFSLTIGIGAIFWAVGNAVWLFSGNLRLTALWWALFLITTVMGERLEISRIALPRRSQLTLFIAGLALSFLSLLTFSLNLFGAKVFYPLFGISLILLGIWLFRHDIARKNLRRPEPARYTAVCMFFGYFWILTSGGISIFYLHISGFNYDALLHGIFLGFLFAMIFGHSFLVASVLFGKSLKFSSALYLPLILLQLSVLLRVIGDLVPLFQLRLWSGIFNGIAIAIYPILLLLSQFFRKR